MKFSIIIPVYNAVKYLRRCLDSVVVQTVHDWECICVDDGSADGSGAILDEYAARDNRFKIIHKVNEGVSVARNTGLGMAKGEYICFVDADDYVLPTWLFWYAEAMSKHSPDFIRIGGYWGSGVTYEIRASSEVEKWLWEEVVRDGYPWAYAIKRAIAEKACFPVGVKMGEDELYLARLIPFISTAVQLADGGYEHVIREESAMFMPLASTERLKYLLAIKEMVTGNNSVNRMAISRLVSDSIMAWLERPADFRVKADIRQVWRELNDGDCARLDAQRRIFRVGYMAYGVTGWLWPARLWIKLVAIGVCLKRACKQFRIAKIVALCAYYGGFDLLFYWLNRSAKRIICFHSVLPDKLMLAGVACGLDLSDDQFRLVIKEVRRYFTIDNDLHNPRSVTLSFDDGFKNQYEVAAKIMKDEGNLPGMLFVAGDLVDKCNAYECLTVELLLAWTAYAPLNALKDFCKKVGMTPEVPCSRLNVWSNVVRAIFAEDVAGKGKNVLAKANEMFPVKMVLNRLSPEYLRLRMTGVSRLDLEDLKESGWLIGWHTKEHFPLKMLSLDEQRKELNPPDYVSKQVMAYPYGDRSSVGEETIKIVQELGYEGALSFDIPSNENINRYYLPRMFVQPDKYALHLELSGFKHFLRTGRLLPRVKKEE